MSFDPVFKSSTELSAKVSAALSAGDIRKIGNKLYTTDIDRPLAELVRDFCWDIVGLIAPGSVIGYRTAIELKPTGEGVVHLVSPSRKRTIDLHGLVLAFHKGPGPLEGDTAFLKLYKASYARGLLESMLPSRRRSKVGSKSLPQEVIESTLEKILQARGTAGLNDIRDHARRLAPLLGAYDQFAQLEDIIGALQGTRKADLRSPSGKARAAEKAYDHHRIAQFAELHATLTTWEPVPRPDPVGSSISFANIAFFDAYFSNWIEGTEFEVEEAREIVFGGLDVGRPQDAHDVRGTYEIVSDRDRMSRSMATAQVSWSDFLGQLRTDHGTLMGGRPEMRPGLFKTVPNRAGETVFVAPDLVEGTLREGLGLLKTLDGPFRRAAFQMFLVSEVHPFRDGNGRTGRIFMNAELIAGGQKRIIVPPVYRDDYLLNLKAASNRRRFTGFLRMLDRAQELVNRIDFSDFENAWEELKRANAFALPSESRLELPPPREG
jgi:fido (protein-threonine AMPylation protein)